MPTTKLKRADKGDLKCPKLNTEVRWFDWLKQFTTYLLSLSGLHRYGVH